jgi:hypothetical protein
MSKFKSFQNPSGFEDNPLGMWDEKVKHLDKGKGDQERETGLLYKDTRKDECMAARTNTDHTNNQDLEESPWNPQAHSPQNLEYSDDLGSREVRPSARWRLASGERQSKKTISLGSEDSR